MAAASLTPATAQTQKEIDLEASPFNIAIIGAGIGGLALAIGLSHHEPPIPFTIYESAAQFSTVGAGVGLGPNALRAMDLIDHRFRQQYMDIATGNARPEKKHVMMEAMLLREGLGREESWWGKGDWGGVRFERTGAHRKDLLDVMTSLVKGSSVRFNKRVQSIEQVGDEVVIRSDDGEVARHAAVVGSDGVKGFTRKVVLGKRYPDCVAPKYSGKYAYRAIIDMPEAERLLGNLATDAKMYMGKGGNISTYPIARGSLINVVAFKRDEREEGWRSSEFTEEVTREEMMADFTDIEGGTDQRLLRLFEHAKPTRWGIFHHPETPTYYSSLICLLGDVAHAGGPHQAAGAGQCLEDALVLSRVLGKLYSTYLPVQHAGVSILHTPSPERTRIIEAAFAAYDDVRRERAQKQVMTTQECGELYNLRSPDGNDDMEHMLRNLNARFEWIWEHDLESDVKLVERKFDEIRGVDYGKTWLISNSV